uniref:Uncharacterized protein n=1 Tax=Steinernema glaseri TaxID=37863 RepID=A0A1I7ZPP6_9BILA
MSATPRTFVKAEQDVEWVPQEGPQSHPGDFLEYVVTHLETLPEELIRQGEQEILEVLDEAVDQCRKK